MWSAVVKVFQQILAHGLLLGGIWFIVESNLLHDAQNNIGVVGYACGTFAAFLILWAGLVNQVFPWLMPWWMIQVHREEDVFEARSLGDWLLILGLLLLAISLMLLPFDDSWAPARTQGGFFIYFVAIVGFLLLLFCLPILRVHFPGGTCFRISREGVYQGAVDGPGTLITLQNFEKAKFLERRKLLQELYIYGKGSVEVQRRWGKKKIVVKKFDHFCVPRSLMGGLSAQEIEDFILRLKEEKQAQVAGSS